MVDILFVDALFSIGDEICGRQNVGDIVSGVSLCSSALSGWRSGVLKVMASFVDTPFSRGCLFSTSFGAVDGATVGSLAVEMDPAGV